MKRLLFLLPLTLLLLSGCKEKRYFTEVTGDVYLSRISFEDESFRDFTVVADVLYAGEDTSSRYKMVFYMPDGWDETYPIFLDRYVPCDGPAWQAYQGVPVAEDALKEGNMIVVLVAYSEWTAIPDILLAEAFLKQHDADLPGDSRNILTAADFDFETAAYYDFE
jgi:hypothetical protein